MTDTMNLQQRLCLRILSLTELLDSGPASFALLRQKIIAVSSPKQHENFALAMWGGQRFRGQRSWVR